MCAIAIADINGVHISYHSFGHGVPIVFIPPPLVGSCVFHHQAHELSSRFQVILIELRGHELSDSAGGHLTYPLITRDICGLLDHVGIDRAVICGYSMAGSIVLEFARTYPNRILGGIPISAFSEATDLRLRAELSAGVSLASVRAMRTLAFTVSLSNADSVRSFQRMFQIGVRSNSADVRSMFQYALKFNCTRDLPNIQTPMRLIFGSKDKRTYKYASILGNGLPNNQVVHVNAARHQIPLKNYRQLNREITEFVSSLK